MKNQLFPALLTLVLLNVSFADKVCIKSTIKRSKITHFKRIVPSTSRCPVGYLEFVNTVTLRGPAGANGSNGSNGLNGVDASTKVWGDGSDGDFVTTTFSEELRANRLYNNITVNAGQFATVSSGATIRCTGTLTLDGGIFVEDGSKGSLIDSTISSSTYYPPIAYFSAKTIGDSLPTFGELVTGSEVASGGSGGLDTESSLSTAHSLFRVNNQIVGAAGTGTLGGYGGDGGGSIAIYCKQGIIINSGGTITADGDDATSGGGGGSGGIVVLASNGAITNSGIINITGGDGGAATAISGQGGSGAGGVVHFISPSVTVGTVNLSGGSANTTPAPASTVSAALRMGGGAGGACGRSGGNGAYVNADGSTGGATAGGNGRVAVTQISGTDVAPLIM